MSKRVKALFSMSIVSVIQIFFNMLRNKVTAVILGTFGIGVVSVINNYVSLITPIASLGMNNGIIKEISSETENKNKIIQVQSTAYVTAFLLSLFSLIAIALLSPLLAKTNLKSEQYYKFFIVLALTIPFTTFNTIGNANINGFREVGIIAKINIISSLVNLIVGVLLIYLFKINGAVYSILVLNIVNGAIVLYYLKKVLNKYSMSFKISLRQFKREVLIILIKFGSSSLVALFISNISMLLIRNIIIEELGMESNGIFQANWAIMNQYLGFLFSSIYVYFFPTLCQLKTNEERTNEMNKTLELLFFIMIPIFFSVITFNEVIINILYSEKFIIAAKILPIFLLGDFFKIICFVLGTVFPAINRLKEFIIFELVFNIAYVSIAFLLIRLNHNLFGIAFSYLLCYLVLSVAYTVFLNNKIKFRLDKSVIRQMSISLILLILIVFTSLINTVNLLFKFSILASFLLIWIYFTLDRDKIAFIKTKLKVFTRKLK
jgi:O-antigen/teichoic acid export membrane protein